MWIMNKILLSILLILLLSVFIFSTKIGVLREVLKPEMIQVFEDELFVVEGATIRNYTLPDLELKMKLGKPGEGPGELKITNQWYNTITVRKNYIFVDSLDKIVFFSRNGLFIKEQKKPYGIHQMVPVGNNFIAMKQADLKDKIQFQSINLYDSKIKLIKQLYKQKSPIQSIARTTEMIPDILNFWVWDNNIYIEKSREGFLIEIFDSSGKKQHVIRKKISSIKVTDNDKQRAVDKFKEDPFVKQIGWDELKKFSKIVFPEMFPPIDSIIVDGKKIFVKTYKKWSNQQEYLVLDLKGNITKKVYLPQVNNAPLMAHLLGVKYYTICQEKFYFIQENDDSEEWELHVFEI